MKFVQIADGVSAVKGGEFMWETIVLFMLGAFILSVLGAFVIFYIVHRIAK